MALNVRLDDLEAELIAALEAAILDLQAQIDLNAGDITLLDAKIDNLVARLIVALNSAINDVQDEIADLQVQIDTNAGNIDTNVDDIAALDIKLLMLLSELETAITIEITGVNVRIDATEGDISLLQADLGGLAARLADVEADIAAIHDIAASCPGGAIRTVDHLAGTVTCTSISAGVGTLQRSQTFGPLVSVGFLSVRSATASCASGFIRTGGGFQVPTDVMFVFKSQPSGNSWQVQAVNNLIFTAPKIRAVVSCIKIES